jgi:hypothetical protein
MSILSDIEKIIKEAEAKIVWLMTTQVSNPTPEPAPLVDPIPPHEEPPIT